MILLIGKTVRVSLKWLLSLLFFLHSHYFLLFFTSCSIPQELIIVNWKWWIDPRVCMKVVWPSSKGNYDVRFRPIKWTVFLLRSRNSWHEFQISIHKLIMHKNTLWKGWRKHISEKINIIVLNWSKYTQWPQVSFGIGIL